MTQTNKHVVKIEWGRIHSGSGCESLEGCHTQSWHKGTAESCLERQGWPEKTAGMQPWLEWPRLWGGSAAEWTQEGGGRCCCWSWWRCVYGRVISTGSLHVWTPGPPGWRMKEAAGWWRRAVGDLEHLPSCRGRSEGTECAGGWLAGCTCYPTGTTGMLWPHLQHTHSTRHVETELY